MNYGYSPQRKAQGDEHGGNMTENAESEMVKVEIKFGKL